MPREITHLDKLYAYMFVTAIENSTWFKADKYHWQLPADQRPGKEIEDDMDWFGFYATGQDVEAGHVGGEVKELRVDRPLMELGLSRLRNGTCTYGGEKLSAHWVGKAAEWLYDPENASPDAEEADVVLQAGLFNDVVYG